MTFSTARNAVESVVASDRPLLGTLTTRYVHGPRVDDHRRLGSLGGDSAPAEPAGRDERERTSQWLAPLGLYDYRNRTYSPTLGRFLQTDPIRFEAGDVNLYRYVFNNPVNWVDPLGLCCDAERTAVTIAERFFQSSSEAFLQSGTAVSGAQTALALAIAAEAMALRASIAACASVPTGVGIGPCSITLATLAIATAIVVDKTTGLKDANEYYESRKSMMVSASEYLKRARHALEECKQRNLHTPPGCPCK